MTKFQEEAIQLAKEEDKKYREKQISSSVKHRDDAFEQLSKELPVQKIEGDPYHLLLEGTKYRISKRKDDELEKYDYYLLNDLLDEFNDKVSYGMQLFFRSQKNLESPLKPTICEKIGRLFAKIFSL